MTKRPLKRLVREGAFDERQFDDDAKIRRLPTARGWTPLPTNDEREQLSYRLHTKDASGGVDGSASEETHVWEQ